jgi:site-specific recombinase XerD
MNPSRSALLRSSVQIRVDHIDERSHELADATLQSHRYRLKQFVQWFDQQDIDNLNELSSRDIHHFRVKRPTKTD